MISCKNFTKAFDGDGVFDISFEIDPGQSLGILGPAGAGKSLIIKALLGQIRPDEGKLTLFSKDSWQFRHQVLQKTAYVPASPALDTLSTGEDYLRFSARYYGGFNPQKARKINEMLDVGLTGRIKEMSLENRKKLSLAAALSRDADVFLLDEPMSGLSPASKAALADLLRELPGNGCACLMTSHVLEEVRRCCTQVLILRKGRMVVHQPVEALQLTRQKVYHITFATAQNAAAFAQEWEEGVELIGSRALVAIPASPMALIKVLAHYQVHDLVGGREDTEESFLRYHGDDIV